MIKDIVFGGHLTGVDGIPHQLPIMLNPMDSTLKT